jgi:hypothetical protein
VPGSHSKVFGRGQGSSQFSASKWPSCIVMMPLYGLLLFPSLFHTCILESYLGLGSYNICNNINCCDVSFPRDKHMMYTGYPATICWHHPLQRNWYFTMALPMLAGGAECGPSNPLQALTKRFDHDRGLQQVCTRTSHVFKILTFHKDYFGINRAGSSGVVRIH